MNDDIQPMLDRWDYLKRQCESHPRDLMAWMDYTNEVLQVADAIIKTLAKQPNNPALLFEFANVVKTLATKGYHHWDADEDSKAGKVLSALAGVPGCYPEIDAIYAQIESQKLPLT